MTLTKANRRSTLRQKHFHKDRVSPDNRDPFRADQNIPSNGEDVLIADSENFQ